MEDKTEHAEIVTEAHAAEEAPAPAVATSTATVVDDRQIIVVDEDEQNEETSDEDEQVGPNARHYLKLPEPIEDRRPPEWFPKEMIPQGFRFPRGLDIAFVRIRGALTATKHKGDRFVIAWELSDGDEKLAYGRSMADANRAAGELAKQMMRVVDGAPTRWDGLGGAGNVDRFWQEIGAKGRSQMLRLYTQLHVYDRTEQADFFENCVGLVRTG
jgi:hypothetical protein